MSVDYLPSKLIFPAGDLDDLWATGTTVMAWVRLQTAGSNSFPRIIDTDTFWVGRATTRSSFFFFHVSSPNAWWDTDEDTVDENVWYHFACYWDRSSDTTPPIFHIDGVEVSPVEPGGTPAAGAAANVADVIIGRRPDNDQAWNGEIEDFRVVERNVGTPEIQEIYNQRGKDRGMIFDMKARASIAPDPSGTVLSATVYDVSPNAFALSTVSSPTAVTGIIIPRV